MISNLNEDEWIDEEEIFKEIEDKIFEPYFPALLHRQEKDCDQILGTSLDIVTYEPVEDKGVLLLQTSCGYYWYRLYFAIDYEDFIAKRFENTRIGISTDN